MADTGGKISWKRAPAWMKLLLVVSLIGNAAIAGMAGGWMARDERQPNEPGLSRQQTRILHMVPEARRDEAREILLSRSDEIAAAREVMRSTQQKMLEAIRAEPFSPEQFKAALAERRAASSEVWGTGYEQLAEIAGKLTAAERAQMADAMEERYRRWTERRQRGQ
ncbi:MAG TPA: periplasmic heavy metal sensor [Thermohalobaculum sp.]|nr:periplasmic heavy metal sensor [Thermohalobaculum sp.]